MEMASLIIISKVLQTSATSAALQSSGITASSSDFLNVMHNVKLISSDNVLSILVCIPPIPAALFSFSVYV